jgi:hypothetical protein
VGPLLDDSQRLNSPFGIWTVHGDSSLAIAAGGGWQRPMTSLKDCPVPPEQIVKKNGDAAEPSNFRHIGVFAFGLPLWMMSLPCHHQDGFVQEIRRSWTPAGS